MTRCDRYGKAFDCNRLRIVAISHHPPALDFGHFGPVATAKKYGILLAMVMKLSTSQIQKQILAPAMQQSIEVLMLPYMELSQTVNQTLQDNPLLEIDEEALRKDMTRLSLKYGRYGYKRITALLRTEGWQDQPGGVRDETRPGDPAPARLHRRFRVIVARDFSPGVRAGDVTKQNRSDRDVGAMRPPASDRAGVVIAFDPDPLPARLKPRKPEALFLGHRLRRGEVVEAVAEADDPPRTRR